MTPPGGTAVTKDRGDRTVEQRLQPVEDRLAIIDLEGANGPAYDRKQDDVWASLFTEDGVYQGRRLTGMPEQNVVRGRQHLASFCRDEPLSGLHLMHAPHITLDGDRATGRVHFQFQASAVDEHGRVRSRAVTGYYDVAYVRTPDGWRIRRRVTTYVEASQRTVHRYESMPADLDEALGADVSYQDRRS